MPANLPRQSKSKRKREKRGRGVSQAAEIRNTISGCAFQASRDGHGGAAWCCCAAP